jgi:hypothetical protein
MMMSKGSLAYTWLKSCKSAAAAKTRQIIRHNLYLSTCWATAQEHSLFMSGVCDKICYWGVFVNQSTSGVGILLRCDLQSL